jgi:hypothetical protein
MLARGMGLDHLKELVRRLSTPLLRQSANLAYGGNWKEGEDNLTYLLLRIIAAEQEDNSLGGLDTNLSIGKLYNHVAWPYYLAVTPKIEAQWINCCRIVRITQQQAGFAPEFVVPDSKAHDGSPQSVFNAAVTLSAMRRLMMDTTQIEMPDVPDPEIVPPVAARILLGGKIASYSGFLPGLFEEALFTLRNSCPLYILGGFGGSAEVLADAILNRPGVELTLDGLKARNSRLASLLQHAAACQKPAGYEEPEAMLAALTDFVEKARTAPALALNTGLSDDETRELLTTNDISTAVRLVRKGLEKTQNLQPLVS